MNNVIGLERSEGADDRTHRVGGIKPSRPPVRLTITVAAEFRDVLDRLSSEMGKDRAEVLRLALGLLRIGLDAKAEGNSLAIITPDFEVDQEIGGF